MNEQIRTTQLGVYFGDIYTCLECKQAKGICILDDIEIIIPIRVSRLITRSHRSRIGIRVSTHTHLSIVGITSKLYALA